jgi:pimeloyl-ACP methyl ester carboxylesterase
MIGAENTFDSGEVVLNYFEGPKAGPPLIILHGITSRHQAFEPLFTPFMSQWQVFAFDLRGHGGSGRTPGHYRVPDYARDIIMFLRTKCTEPAILIGHSLGGLTILEVASQIPERIRALVALDPALFLRNQPFEVWKSIRTLQLFCEMKQASLSFEDMVTTLHHQPFLTSDEAFYQELATEIFQLDKEALITALQNQLLVGWDLEQDLQTITVPTLHIYGDWGRGSAVREEDATYFKANLPQAMEVKIPDAGHMFPIMQPKLTVDIIRNFLKSV